ncbi:hypothetical protein QR97_15765 [Streptomyces sp. PBH53]|uniref:hypothetical protein n=1 Tax=Streptomyces sp. PBH53 TaxID=1577075 RepID=UPI0006552C89|nr:hypothetical protein [Streptomyces sp. PBH53]AKN71075.1 hypothetical protein QR97_15765 [Streptomyces sp. PBH53]
MKRLKLKQKLQATTQIVKQKTLTVVQKLRTMNAATVPGAIFAAVTGGVLSALFLDGLRYLLG